MTTHDQGRARAGITLGLLAILAATNHWTSWNGGIKLVTGRDAVFYKVMALAAPKLPPTVPNQHAQEFPLVYVVGFVAHVLSVNVDYVFRATVFAVIAAIIVCLHRALKRSGVGLTVYALCMAVFILNTYSLRYYLIVPGYFLDLTFVLAIAIAIQGLIGGRYWVVVVGVVLATLARQSTLPASFAIAWWVAFGAGWRDAPGRLRAARAIAIVVLPVGLFLALVAISASFSESATPGVVGLTAISDLERLTSRIGALIEHWARVAHPLFSVASLTVVTLFARRRSGTRAKLPPEFVGCLVVGGSIAVQPLLLSTTYDGHPERLTVLSLLPFVIGLAYLLRERELAGFLLPVRTVAVMIGVLAVGSLHYLFTSVGPATAVEGALLQLVAAIIVGAMLWLTFTGRLWPPQHRPGQQGSRGQAPVRA
jgi:hypothetical protein